MSGSVFLFQSLHCLHVFKELFVERMSGHGLCITQDDKLHTCPCYSKAQAALVRANCIVELDAVTAIDLNLTISVNPWDREHDVFRIQSRSLFFCPHVFLYHDKER